MGRYDWLQIGFQRYGTIAAAHQETLEIVMNDPATADSITAIELRLRTKLPASVKEFLFVHDGFKVLIGTQFVFWPGIFPVVAIQGATESTRSELDYALGPWNRLIVIGDYGDGADHFGFDSADERSAAEPRIIDLPHHDPTRWGDKVVAADINELLKNAFEAILLRDEYPFYWRASGIQSSD